ncbi:MAG: hypothetical protein ACOVN0_12255, partial [Niveispirillum sp.]|uniref:hypothetical protein n=1 Tax=Niveispirillum sp. TaxID=1917217 RepID=UPI003BA831E7
GNTLPQEPEMLADLLNRLLASQRLHWQSLEGPALRQGPPRRCRIGWSADDKGRQVPALHVLGEADDTPARHPAGADHPSAAQTEAEPLAGTAGARRPGLSGL